VLKSPRLRREESKSRGRQRVGARHFDLLTVGARIGSREVKNLDAGCQKGREINETRTCRPVSEPPLSRPMVGRKVMLLLERPSRCRLDQRLVHSLYPTDLRSVGTFQITHQCLSLLFAELHGFLSAW
jgi:hypothetical protein